MGKPVLVTLVKQWNDLLLEQPVERLGVTGVIVVNIQIFRWVADGPTIISVVAFVPPAVKHADVQDAIHRSLLPARTAGLQRRTRIV